MPSKWCLAKEMSKRYAINAINATITKYDYETVLTALELIPASTISLYKNERMPRKRKVVLWQNLSSLLRNYAKRQAA